MPVVDGWDGGIYVLRNKLNGKGYVGSAVSFKRRWWSHRTKLRAGRHPNNHLQAAWNRDGEENFEFVVLERCSRSFLLEMEKRWIHDLQTADREFGYNKRWIPNSNLGLKMSEETKAKMSKVQSAMRAAGLIDNGQKGKPGARLGMKHTEQARRKISEAKKGKPGNRKGCKWTFEQRQKLYGRKRSAQARANMSAAAKAAWGRKRQGK